MTGECHTNEIAFAERGYIDMPQENPYRDTVTREGREANSNLIILSNRSDVSSADLAPVPPRTKRCLSLLASTGPVMYENSSATKVLLGLSTARDTAKVSTYRVLTNRISPNSSLGSLSCLGM
jgi:hypothetical protein